MVEETGKARNDEGLQQQRARLREMLAHDFATLDYTQAHSRAVVWNQLFREELAAALTPRLNQHLAQIPQQTLEQMRSVATTLNAQLKQIGLAISSPATHHPSLLNAETKNAAEPNVFRYRFQETNEKGHRPKRHCAFRKLPELTLMPLPARIESFSRHYRKTDRSPDENPGAQR